MVTRKEYQSGAIKTARNCNIYLKKFQLPEDINWESKIRTIIIDMHILTIENIKRTPILDKNWLLQQHFSGNEKLSINNTTDNIFLIDKNGNKIKTLYELENELPRGEKAAYKLKYSFPFKEDTFMQNDNGINPKIKRIDYEYDIFETIEEIKISADDVIHGLLSDIDGQESFLFFLNNSIQKI